MSSCIMSAQSYLWESVRNNPPFPLRSKEASVKPQDACKEILDVLQKADSHVITQSINERASV